MLHHLFKLFFIHIDSCHIASSFPLFDHSIPVLLIRFRDDITKKEIRLPCFHGRRKKRIFISGLTLDDYIRYLQYVKLYEEAEKQEILDDGQLETWMKLITVDDKAMAAIKETIFAVTE